MFQDTKMVGFLTLGILVGLSGCSALGCESSPMDVVFLLDSSDDMPLGLFDEAKKLTSSIINDIWDGQNEVGLVTFGSSPQTQFKLNMYTSVSEIQLAVQYLWQSTGHSDVAKALDFAIKSEFDSSNGGRILARDVLVLITASDIRNEPMVHSIAQSLQYSQVELFVVLVGHVSRFWYEKLTSPDKILKVNDVSSLISISGTLKTNVCIGRGILRTWSEWSSCDALCDYGQRRRFRNCEKKHQNDRDCNGKLMDEESCIVKPCTAPVDGMWSIWGEWSKCSKTCQKGERTRRRTCTAPFPENGGKPCPGERIQSQNCSDWSCPDCKRQCPPGSHLSDQCDVCLCSNVWLFGKIQSEVGVPIADAKIFLKSKLYSPVAVTSYDGKFSVDGICIVNETVTIRRTSFSALELTPTMLNNTHWEVKVNLSTLDVPVFILHPENKHRLVGQSVSLCCIAVGYPSPTHYKWFKGTDPLEQRGENGTLTFDSVTINDSGTYKCFTETEAGATTSNSATLVIKDGLVDTCSSPFPELHELPAGCYVKGDQTRNSTMDIGSCGKKSCVSRDLIDNHTCIEWWPHHCCDTDGRELVEVICGNFSYQTSRVTSCKCRVCFEETLITGKAFGRFDNGSITPLQYGTVEINGKEVTMTNMAGIFTAKIPKQTQRLVISFQDRIHKKFMDATKVFFVTPGTSTSISVTLSFRPKPIEFRSDSDLVIEVGNSGDLVSPGRMSIEKNSLVTMDGQPFNGKAKATVNYMDPRNLNDFEAANGEFSTDDNGQSCPLETYGVFTSIIEDETGNPLRTNKPITFEMDPTVFNITSNNLGKPNVELWQFNENTGTWIAAGVTNYQVSTSRRRLLATQNIVSIVNLPDALPTINHLEPQSHIETTLSYQTIYKLESYKNYYISSRPWIFNWDTRAVPSRVPIYTSVVVKDPDRPKRGACYVGVKVYTVVSFTKLAGEGIQVKAITKTKNESSESKYIGVDIMPTDKNSHVCLKIFCDSIVYLSSGSAIKPLYAFPSHDVPSNLDVRNMNSGKLVEFESIHFGNVNVGGNKYRYNPVYYYEDYSKCTDGSEDDFKFQFGVSQFNATQIDYAVGENINDNKLSWYPSPPNAPARTVCFIKVAVKIKNHFDLRLMATSYQQSGGQYGTFNVAPIPELDSDDMIERAACIEFRCPGLVNNNGVISNDIDTMLEVRIFPEPNPPCRLVNKATGLNITQIQDGQGFRFYAKSGTNYGPLFGVYIATTSKPIVERYCFQGLDTGTINVGMKPKQNAAIQYDCT